MARKSRKVSAIQPQKPQGAEQPERRVYLTGCYARLSVEDSGRPGADSIQTQEAILREFVDAQPDMKFCGQYSDNGRTGTNFERPAFERLMDDVRHRKIDCIVVKDLSRFGRNYRETGNYLSRVFPFLDVRFVAITDNFDTLTAEKTGEYYTVPLKNILNDVYSKDISRKSGSALRMKQQRGEFIGAWAPYGYRKSPEDHHKLEPLEETAAVVRDMFRMRVEGTSYNLIARSLNQRGILSPSTWLYQNGFVKTERYANVQWNMYTVKKILTDEVYLGHMVQGRKRSGLCEGRKQRVLPKSEWTVVRNTHEPVIDEETFQIVQRMAEDTSALYHERLGKYQHLGDSPNLFTRLVFCADCGRPLVRHKQVIHGRRVQYVFICQKHTNDPASCPLKYVLEEDLKGILWETIQREIALSDSTEDMVERYSRTREASGREQALRRDAADAKQAYEKASLFYDSLYPNYVAHIITEEDYTRMKRSYQEAMEQADSRMKAAETALRDYRQETVENPWLTAFRQFRDEPELTERMAHALVERIEADAENHITVTLRYRNEYLALIQRLDAGKAVEG